MAEKALKKLKEQLNCVICLDTYTDPKLLQCNHVFCRKCLVHLAVRDNRGRLILPCPTCRHDTSIPATGTGVADLQSAFHINYLLEIQDLLQEVKDPVVISAEVKDSKVTPYCSEHEGKELELYCEKCEELICYKCAFKGGKHHYHDSEQIEVLVEKCKGEIMSSLKPMEEKLTIVNKALAQLDTRSGEISDQRADIEANIHNKIQRLHEFLDGRKTELIGQLHQITQRKLKGLATQRDQIETTQVQLSSCLNFVREKLNTGSNGEVVNMKTSIVKQMNKLTSVFQPDILKPNTEADITFSVSPDITAVCQKYGEVYTARDPDPSKCYATGKGLEEAVVGEKSIFHFNAVNFKDEPCNEPLNSLQCELVSEVGGTTVRCSVEKTEQNQYDITYQPTLSGMHQLHIKISGQHIRGSPFFIAVKFSLIKFNIPNRIIGRFNFPWGIAVGQRGEVVVSELGKHCVSFSGPDETEFQSIGTRGSAYGEFSGPRGIALDGEGNILVADYSNHRVQKFTTDGQFLTATRELQHPRDIAYNTTNNKLYMIGISLVRILNSDLTSFICFGSEELINSRAIACDSSGNVYVVDRGKHCIQVFTAEGQFLRMFSRHSQDEGVVDDPMGIAIDASGIVYVSEYDNNCISVFTSEGHFVSSFGSYGGGSGDFRHPVGLAVDNSGTLYVCDGHNNRIQVF